MDKKSLNILDELLSIYVSINPKNHQVELNWFNLMPEAAESTVLITDGPVVNVSMEIFLGANRWTLDNGVELLYDSVINSTDGQQETSLKHNFADHRRIDFDTGCYKYWWSLVVDGVITNSGCFRTNAFWMNEMRQQLENKKVRQLFLPGTHDSASYKYNFDPNRMETLVSRYTLTQDDDILSQLVHGIRYLDIRVGYYRSNDEHFWANHGISRIHPLSDILRQAKEFVDSTDEIIILDFQEFPVGFSRGLEIHKQLLFFLYQQVKRYKKYSLKILTVIKFILKLENYAADPDLTWDAHLKDIWRSGKRIIVAYDHFAMVQDEGHGFLWQSVRQRWGKVKEGAAQLEKFLRGSRSNLTNEFQTSRPFAEMAELTPEAVDVLTNRYGGLRSLAASVNWNVSKLYNGDFGVGANIVAVDFYQATNLVQIAIDWNKRKLAGN